MSEEKRRVGFAGMDPERQREIAGRGGRAAHERGSAHKFTSEEASAAGKRGGATVSRDKEHMAAIGRLGGQVGGKRRRVVSPPPDSSVRVSQDRAPDAPQDREMPETD